MMAWRPVAYLAIRDDAMRTRLEAVLRQTGWTTISAPTGVDLVHALSGLILGDESRVDVGLVVVDEALPGCRGSTIAAGLRDLGIVVPVAIIAPDRFDDQLAGLDDPDRGIYVLDAASAQVAVGAIAHARTVAARMAIHGTAATMPTRVDRRITASAAARPCGAGGPR
jgi:hypothetical protein